MSEKPLRREQENIYSDKQYPLASNPPLHSNDLQYIEDRILQETQPTSNQNGLYYKSQRLSQEYSSSSSASTQYDKNANIQALPKGGDKELRQILRENISPTASVGANDLSYRIVNEILNTQNGNRSQFKLKMSSRIAERRRSPLLMTQIPNENMNEMPNSNVLKDTKGFFEENEGLRLIQAKITEIHKKIEDKKTVIETARRRQQEEILNIQQAEVRVKGEKGRLRERLSTINHANHISKDKSGLNKAKEKLKVIKAEFHSYEREILRLKEIIDKQEREKLELEQRVSKAFNKQINEFDEALRSIEDQKVGIYSKLNEAMHCHNENLEQKAMFKEDLSARLLQRADLVAQREDLEQVIENLKSNHPNAINFCQSEINLKEQINTLMFSLDELSSKRQVLLKQLENHNSRKSSMDLSRENSMEATMNGWREICDAGITLSMKAKDVGLIDFEDICRKVIRQWGMNIDKRSVWFQLKETSDEGQSGDSVKEVQMKAKIVQESLEVWKIQILENLGGCEGLFQEGGKFEGVEDSVFIERISRLLEGEEDREFLVLFNNYTHKLRSFQENGSGSSKHNVQVKSKVEAELRKIEQDIHDKEFKKREFETELYRNQEVMENALMNEAETAFEAYMQQQAQNFESVSEQYGAEAAEEMKHQNRREFIEITQQNVTDQIQHFINLKQDLQYLEQTIRNNTESVDKNVLPSLQILLSSIEEGSVLLTALKKQQMLLLETEDEVSGQFNYILEQRDGRVKRSHEKYDESTQYSLKELRNAKKMLEKKIEPISMEISRLESQIIEADKHATEGIFEERRLQKEYEDINKEYNQLGNMQRTGLQNTEIQIETYDKELRDLQKALEHLEMQKLTLEQQFIEQNYLTEDFPQNSTPVTGFPNEKSLKAFNVEIKGNRSASGKKEQPRGNIFSDKENYGRVDRRLHNMKIQGITDIGGPSDENLDLSPIGRGSQSPDNHEGNPKRDLLNELNSFSQQGLLSNKASANVWNCFSPIGSALSLGGSFKGKKLSSSKKERSRDRAEELQRDETTYLRNYQKRLGQKQVSTGSNPSIKPNATTASLDMRTRSLPQTANQSVKKPDSIGFATQLTSPKDAELVIRPQSVYQARELLSAKNIPKSPNSQGLNMYKKQNLAESAKSFEGPIKKKSGDMALDDSINVFSPKTLTLHINSLKTQTSLRNGIPVPQSLRSATSEQSKLKDFLGYHEYLSGKKIGAGSFVEPKHKTRESEGDKSVQDDKTGNPKPRKSLSLETSGHLEDHGSLKGLQRRAEITNRAKKGTENFSFSKGNLSQEITELTTRRAYHNLHGIAVALKKGQASEEGGSNYEEEGRSKSTEFGGRSHARLNGITSRDLECYANGESLDLKGGITLVSHLGSPIAIGHEARESIIETKGKYANHEQNLNENTFFETIKPLLQGSLLYKKFTNYQSLKRSAFDPLTGDIYPPETCGYGVRSIRLHPSLDKIEIRHTSKPSVEMLIPIDQIIRPVVPQLTMDILRVQKKIVESQNYPGPSEDKLQMAEMFGDLNTKALLAKRGVNSLNNGMERYLNCSYYTFSIHLEKNGKAEFVAGSYGIFKEWINGLNMLLKYKKQLSKMKNKLKNYKL